MASQSDNRGMIQGLATGDLELMELWAFFWFWILRCGNLQRNLRMVLVGPKGGARDDFRGLEGFDQVNSKRAVRCMVRIMRSCWQ